jgi:hypothetical protein
MQYQIGKWYRKNPEYAWRYPSPLLPETTLITNRIPCPNIGVIEG